MNIPKYHPVKRIIFVKSAWVLSWGPCKAIVYMCHDIQCLNARTPSSLSVITERRTHSRKKRYPFPVWVQWHVSTCHYSVLSLLHITSEPLLAFQFQCPLHITTWRVLSPPSLDGDLSRLGYLVPCEEFHIEEVTDFVGPKYLLQ